MSSPEQFDLVVETLRTEYLDGVGGETFVRFEGQVARYEVIHLGRESLGSRLVDGAGAVETAVVAARNRVLDAQTRSGVAACHGSVEQHTQRAGVDPRRRRRRQRLELNLLGMIELKPEVFVFVVYEGADRLEAETSGKLRHPISAESLASRYFYIF